MEIKELVNIFYEKTWLNKLEDNCKDKPRISNSMFFMVSKNDIECLKYVREGGKTLSDIAKYLKITKPSVTAMIYRLKKIGLVDKKQSNNDKRVYYINLTNKAKDLLEYDKNKFFKLGEIINQNLTTDDVLELMRIFKKAQII